MIAKFTVLFLVCFGASQARQLDCRYFLNVEFGNGYRTCQVVNMKFDEKPKDLKFSGTQEQKDWVELVQIRESKTLFVPTQVFEAFKNIKVLEIMNVTLKNIDQSSFKNAKTLERFWARDNVIERITNNTFIEAPAMTNIGFQNNSIRTVEPLAFAGLTKLIVLKLEYNQIESLPEKVFAPLVNLEKLFMRNNKLTSLSSSLFEKNSALVYVNFQNNLISKIGSNIFDNKSHLQRVLLLDNICISIEFNKINGSNQDFKNALKKCEKSN